jgi:hypothetical protein
MPLSREKSRLTVKVITRLQLVSMNPTDAYNCHNITLYGSGLAGVNLVWFGGAFQKPWSVTSTQIQVEVSESRTPYIGQAFMPMTWEHPPLFDQDVRESL